MHSFHEPAVLGERVRQGAPLRRVRGRQSGGRLERADCTARLPQCAKRGPYLQVVLRLFGRQLNRALEVLQCRLGTV